MYTLETLCTNVICSAGVNPAGDNGIKTTKSNTDTILFLACNWRSTTASMSANVPKWVIFTAHEQFPTAPELDWDEDGAGMWYCNKNGSQNPTKLGMSAELVTSSTLRTCMPWAMLTHVAASVPMAASSGIAILNTNPVSTICTRSKGCTVINERRVPRCENSSKAPRCRVESATDRTRNWSAVLLLSNRFTTVLSLMWISRAIAVKSCVRANCADCAVAWLDTRRGGGKICKMTFSGRIIAAWLYVLVQLSLHTGTRRHFTAPVALVYSVSNPSPLTASRRFPHTTVPMPHPVMFAQ